MQVQLDHPPLVPFEFNLKSNASGGYFFRPEKSERFGGEILSNSSDSKAIVGDYSGVMHGDYVFQKSHNALLESIDLDDYSEDEWKLIFKAMEKCKEIVVGISPKTIPTASISSDFGYFMQWGDSHSENALLLAAYPDGNMSYFVKIGKSKFSNEGEISKIRNIFTKIAKEMV